MAESKVQSRVFLKNGMGSVAAEDYDEKVHGKALELTDDEYHARLGVRPAATAAHPPTTIANLQTFDTATAAPAAPAPVPPQAPAAPPVGKPVATVEEPKADEAKKSGAAPPAK